MSVSQPVVSICVPVYNKAHSVDRLFTSIERQEIPDVEIVAVDNASTDHSAAVLDAWRYRLNLKVHKLPRTISAPENWLLALSLGTGDLLRLQLADDVIPDGALAAQLAVFRERSDVDFVFGKTYPMDSLGQPISSGHLFEHWAAVNLVRERIGATRTLPDKNSALATLPMNISPFGDASSVVFRRDLLPVLREGVDHDASAFHTFPEYEIFLRLLAASTPCFIDVFTSAISHDDDGFAARHRDLDFRRRGVDIPSANMLLIAALDPALRSLMRAGGRRYLARITFWQLRLARRRMANRYVFTEWVDRGKRRLRSAAAVGGE
jgi:glycosyltransferase involved in cell wall biosynthesis